MARQSKMPAPPSKAALEENPELAPDMVPDLDGGAELDVAAEPMPVQAPAPMPAGKKKLKVVANRAGFIHQHRKVAGDRFEVDRHELGSWMDCEDPHEQKKHLKRLEDKRKGVNEKAVADDKAEREKFLADE